MSRNKELITFSQYGRHKGFYNDNNVLESLCHIKYTDFFIYPDDDEFPYDTADSLLSGSCNHFAVALQKALGYTPYIIEGKCCKSFHAFCQIYERGTFYYIDARGITSSFDEFMIVASKFVHGEHTIREATLDIIEDWESGSNYNKEAYAFSEAVINKYRDYYTL